MQVWAAIIYKGALFDQLAMTAVQEPKAHLRELPLRGLRGRGTEQAVVMALARR
jgi:hypothetical protein